MPSSREQPKASPHPHKLGFLFLIHPLGGHTVPPPPGQKNVFFCTARPAVPGPSPEIHTRKRAICHPCRRGAPGADEHPQPKAGGASGRKKNSARVIYPNGEGPSHPTKIFRPGLSWMGGPSRPHPTLPLSSPQHPQGAAPLGKWQSWKRAFVYVRGLSCLSQKEGN